MVEIVTQNQMNFQIYSGETSGSYKIIVTHLEGVGR